MRINHNISALKANNILNANNSSLESSLEKLSSGFRINRAADDAAGLAISEKMKTQIAGLEQASRNASDGISVIQTAEGALVEVEEMLQRMRELSVQAANGTNTNEDRSALQAEITQLQEEINRISDTTEFNTKKLLNGTVDRRSYSDNTDVRLISLSDSVDIKSYTFSVDTNPKQATIEGTLASPTYVTTADSVVDINGTKIEIPAGSSTSEIYGMISGTCDSLGITVVPTKDVTVDVGGVPTTQEVITSITDPDVTGMRFTTNEFGVNAALEIYTQGEIGAYLGIGNSASAVGVDATITLDTSLTGGFGVTATVSVDGDYVTVSDLNDFEMVFQVDEAATGDATVTVLKAGPMTLQIGANEGQTMEVRIPRVDTTSLMVDSVDVSTETGAADAIPVLNEAINQVSSIRAKLGAYQNRIEHAINSLDVSAENLTEALSRIADVDMAGEMATYTQLQVLTQAGTAMLAQANERPQSILSLLQA